MDFTNNYHSRSFSVTPLSGIDFQLRRIRPLALGLIFLMCYLHLNGIGAMKFVMVL